MTRYSIQASLIGHGGHRGIFDDVADAGAKSTVRLRGQSKSATGPNKARGNTAQVLLPPTVIMEQFRNGQMVRFMGEKVATIHKQGPQITDAGCKRIAQVNITEGNGHRLIESGQRVLEIAFHQIRDSTAPKSGDVVVDGFECSFPCALAVTVNLSGLQNVMPCIIGSRFGQSFKRIEDEKLPLSHGTGMRQIYRTTTKVGTAFYNATWRGLQNCIGDGQLFGESGSRRHAESITKRVIQQAFVAAGQETYIQHGGGF